MRNRSSNLKKTSLELEDHSWFPDALRAYQTDVLGSLAKCIGLYRPAIDFMSDKIPNGLSVVDLASGSGVPALLFFQNRDVELTLCDKFPDQKTVDFVNRNFNVTYLNHSIDIVENEIPEGKIYLMFNSVHHFNFGGLIKILQKVKNSGGTAYFFEPLTPTVFTFIKVFIATLILPFFLAPFIRPFRWDRLLFTYILPLGVITTFWDGLVSLVKSYSSSDLVKLKKEVSKSGLQISVGILHGRFTNLTYIELRK